VELKRLRDETALLQARFQNAAAAVARRNLAAATYDVSQLDQIPQAQFRVPPQYPLEMRQAGTSGEVTVEFIVDANGEVRNASAIKSTRSEFEQAAVDAVKAWTFRPGMKNSKQVFTRMQVPIVFTLSPGPQLGTPLPKSNDQAAPASLNWF
jgi:TonB family protein